jgi:uncharacterized membrane protein
MPEINQTKPGWRRIALPVSIVLNLFLIAVIGGHILHVRVRLRESHVDTPLARALANAESILPASDAEKFRAVIRRDAPHYMDAAHQLGEARQEVERQILAEPFDQERVNRALAGWEAAWNRFFGEFNNTLVEALAEISPEGRRQLVAKRREERAKAWSPFSH